MLKVKQKLATILLACLTALMAICTAFGLLLTPVQPARAEDAAPTSGGGYFEKVTSTPSDWSGYYLIVYESGKAAFNGGLSTLDAKNNYVSVTITSNKIECTNADIANAYFTINASGHIKSKSNFYIGKTANSNGLDAKTTILTNTITVSNDLTVKSSGGAYLRFNASSSEMRFRYYKSSSYTGQKAIQLYKWVKNVEEACIHAETCAVPNGEGFHNIVCANEDCKTVITENVSCTNTNTVYTYTDNNTHTVETVCADCGQTLGEITSEDCQAESWSDYTIEDGNHTRTGTCKDCSATLTETGVCTIDENGWSDYTTLNGKHTRTGTCSVCKLTMTETGVCVINAETTPNGDNTHSSTGTCSVCGDYTTNEIDCTSDENVIRCEDNGNGTHNEISACTECKGEYKTTVGCTFTETDNGDSVTYTCDDCGYSYTENYFTVEFSVPDGATCVTKELSVLPNGTVDLNSISVTPPEGYTFEGWVEKANRAISKTQPDLFTSETEITGDIKLYALFAYTETVYNLVTDASSLKHGDQVVIVASEYDYALGATQYNNNRAAVTITKSDDTVTINSNVQILTLQEDTTAGTFALDTGSGYLYAASSSGNQLKTKAALDNNGSWKISITNGIASIVAQGTNTRNVMQYNPNTSNNNPLFACYASANQKALSLYRRELIPAWYTTLQFDCASITVGQDLVMNYKVSIPEDFAGAEMTFTMNDKTTTVTGNKVGTQYVYSLNIAPQCMGDKISAVLKFGDTVLATKAEYSVTDYAEYQLNNNPSDELKQLLVDMLHYGAAAQVYQNYKTDALATSILTEEQKTLASTATAEESDSVFELSSAKNPAYFTGAGVYFAAQNKLYVKLSTTENVKLKINGAEVALNSTTVFTEGIFATDFDKTFTFTLYYNDEEVQTLTYSVNSYVYEYAQQSGADPIMIDLANTLYRYGMAADAYAEAQNNQA